MNTVIFWILAIATIVGGIAAVGYFRDKWSEKQQWVIENKEVNSTWWESSELKEHYEANGYKDFAWSNSERVPERIAEGKEIVYELDNDSQIKYKLVNRSGQVLMCRIGVQQ